MPRQKALKTSRVQANLSSKELHSYGFCYTAGAPAFAGKERQKIIF